MSCESTRESMMELEVAQFEALEHLKDCEPCKAFAEEIRAAEQAMGAHVEAFARSADFDADWADARSEAVETDEVPRRRRWPFVVAPVLLAAVAALVVLPNWRPDPPAVVAPVHTPAPAVQVDTGLPSAHRPAPAPGPRPAARPRPAPEPAPSAPSPAPAPSPMPSPSAPVAASAGVVVVSGLPDGASAAVLRCGDHLESARVSAGTVSLPAYEGRCVLTVRGVELAPLTVSGPGRYRLVEGALQPD